MTVVVKTREFEMQMEALGKIKHENVVPLRTFYFSKDDKLLVYDYMSAGSLYALLHGRICLFGRSRGSGRIALDWESRMRIAATEATRGVACLQVPRKVVHGNIKSSNILLRMAEQEVDVSDYGLNPLFGNRVSSSYHAENTEKR
ncbi:hypothetical protein Fmac_031156 [Flemingia macrophylla]|uniref:Protein kinase domain-containing protein n=1 Tax=Flemingia macrophylla TaxID=520843 RepID=A0ABD1L181_9FABA